MNKELIEKYFNEFSHFIHGGEVLFFTWKWYNSKDNPDTTFSHSKPEEIKYYVINDAYVELRKALAEGKTLQWTDGPDYWIDINHINIFIPLDKYRIKPEKPQFKAGDWVRDVISGKVHQVNNEDICNGSYSQVAAWKPKPKEWCWKLTAGCYSLMRYPGNNFPTTNLEPFIGTLPTKLQ